MTKQIPLSQGKFALVDDDMFEYLSQWKWFAHKAGNGKWYAARDKSRLLGKRGVIWMHRIIANTPSGMETDHVDRNDTLNNQRNNLRTCTKAQNQANTGKRSDNTSGYKGVTWHKRDRKWHARIQQNSHRIHIGAFSTPEEAAHAYDQAAREHFGEFANMNFPE